MGLIIPTRGLYVPAAGGSWTTLLEDNFTGAGSDTDLDAWDATETGSWDHDTGSTGSREFIVDASDDRIRPDNNSNSQRTGSISTTSPPTADQRMTATVHQWAGSSIQWRVQMRLRIQGSGACYQCSCFFASGQGQFNLERLTSNTGHVDLDSHNFSTEAAGDQIRFSVVGDALSVELDPGSGFTEIMSATDSNITAAGDMGVGTGFGTTFWDINNNATQFNYVLMETQ